MALRAALRGCRRPLPAVGSALAAAPELQGLPAAGEGELVQVWLHAPSRYFQARSQMGQAEQ